MATALTHIGFVNDLKKQNPKFFKNLNLDYVYSGALFPDYYGFYQIQLKKKYELVPIIKNKNGVLFGKRMLKLSKTKEEKSFAIGFITHSILDEYFHNYFRKFNASIEEHLILEFFYDCKFKNLKIPLVKYPSKIIEKTLLKYHKKFNLKKTDITKIKLLGYYLFLKEIQTQIILKKYVAKKKSYMDIISLFFYRGKFNLKKLLNPDSQLKNKHVKKLEMEYKKALLKNIEILNTIKI